MDTVVCASGSALDSWTSHAWSNGVQIDALADLDCVQVRTRNSVYEITVLAPFAGEVLVRGGRFFPEPTRAIVAGCSLGGGFLKRRGIYVGFLLELQHQGRTIVTTRIRSISRPTAGTARPH